MEKNKKKNNHLAMIIFRFFSIMYINFLALFTYKTQKNKKYTTIYESGPFSMNFSLTGSCTTYARFKFP